MKREDIERRLIESLREVQELSGHAATEITVDTCPIDDLEGFDSLRGVETTALLAINLNCEFNAGAGDVNVFVSTDGRRALTVKETVARLMELLK